MNDIATIHDVPSGCVIFNITHKGQNGYITEPVRIGDDDEELLRLYGGGPESQPSISAEISARLVEMAQEAVRGGGVAGIEADPDADFSNYTVEPPYKPGNGINFWRVFLRPKVPFGGDH